MIDKATDPRMKDTDRWRFILPDMAAGNKNYTMDDLHQDTVPQDGHWIFLYGPRTPREVREELDTDEVRVFYRNDHRGEYITITTRAGWDIDVDDIRADGPDGYIEWLRGKQLIDDHPEVLREFIRIADRVIKHGRKRMKPLEPKKKTEEHFIEPLPPLPGPLKMSAKDRERMREHDAISPIESENESEK